MGNYSKKVTVLVNIAIIVIAVLLGIGFAMNHPFAEPPHFASRIIVGSRAPLSNSDWAKNEQTLLLVVLQRGCRFCSESAPFYQQLVQEAAGRESVLLIAVLPQSSDESKQYLQEIGMPVKEVKRASLAALEVSGTPTLILVNSKGVVTDSWLGKLTAGQESEVLKRLQEDTVAGR